MKKGLIAVIIAALAFVGAGCKNVNKNISSPTSPTPVTPAAPQEVTAAVAAITQVSTNLNQTCPISVRHKATARVGGSEVGAQWLWSVTTNPDPKSFNPSGDTAETVFDLPGNYRITATAVVNNQTVSAHTDVALTGSGCRPTGQPQPPQPPPPPPPPPTPPPPASSITAIDYSPPGGDIQLGSSQEVQATCWVGDQRVACTELQWSSRNPSSLPVERLNPLLSARIRAQALGSGDICVALVANTGVSKCHNWRVTSAPPPPPPPPAPTLNLSANPTTITVGQSSTLTWSSTGTVHPCTATGSWTGSRGVNGTESVTPLVIGQNTYTLQCSGVDGSILIRSVVVTVNQAPPPPSCTLTQLLTPQTGEGTPGQKMTVQARWSSTGGASCPGWYYSTDPSKVGVNGTTGEVTFISRGTVTICGQPAVNRTDPRTCGTFTTR